MSPGIILAVFSGVVYATAYVDYNRKILSGKTTPNGATWAIWVTIALVSSLTYLAASGDAWKTVIPLINIAFCLATFVLALARGKFQKLNAPDWVALFLGLAAVVVWKVGSAAYASIMVQAAIAIGFVPTWAAVRRNPWCEHPLPWWLWSLSYVLAVGVVFLRWRGQWIDATLPVNCAILHASVPVVAFVKQRRTTLKMVSGMNRNGIDGMEAPTIPSGSTD